MAKMNKMHCAGCRNNFYNGNNNLGVSECWSLKTAKLITRYQIYSHVPTYRENFIKVRKPSCYHQQGVYFTDSLNGYPSKGKAK